ncbi:hypothetical protein [Phytoactinopolyspora mesophila]|uniref:hypothetical protein n=1 Tax=Phytoactinopolyspora mesophila TaxID=2650750 RepID=UPI001FE6F997|nr:hypothetical protein [Phytoactinopolyspora mesophila]
MAQDWFPESAVVLRRHKVAPEAETELGDYPAGVGLFSSAFETLPRGEDVLTVVLGQDAAGVVEPAVMTVRRDAPGRELGMHGVADEHFDVAKVEPEGG